LVTFGLRFVINASPHGRIARAKWLSRQPEESPMFEKHNRDMTNRTDPALFATTQGEQWRRFLERVGTRSNDFASRLSRARFVYLHRREASATQWLAL
jgi:hypothetical protein